MTRPNRKRASWIVLGSLAAGTVLVMTLWPMPHLASDRNFPLSIQWQFNPPDILRNLILFAAPAALTRRWGTGRVLAVAGLTSVSIELLQIFIPGRVPSLLDVLANVAGAWLGHRGVVWLADGPGHPWQKTRALYIGWALFTAVLLVSIPVAFRPHLPSLPWFAHSPPQLGHLETYQGANLEARLNGLLVPHGRLHQPGLETQLLESHQLEIRGQAGPAPTNVSGLFLITDYTGQEVLLLGLQGTDLFYRIRSLGDEWGLEPTRFWWRGAFSPDPSEEGDFVVHVQDSGTGVCVQVNRRSLCRDRPRLEEAWQHWIPARALGTQAHRNLDYLWPFALFFPLGAGYRPRVIESLFLLFPLSALLIGPSLGPISSLSLTAAALIIAGFAMGQVVSFSARRTLRKLQTLE
ncbi:MAG: VanZ family protein [Myxococcota bacterium]|nr:VanZ family protein [Myxococcota bacterium]